MKVIIVGHGASGWTVAYTLRVWDRKADITVVDAKDYDVYHPCALPYPIGGALEDEETLKESIDYERMKIRFLRKHKALSIDRKNKVVSVKDLERDEQKNLEYDYLVLCTGSKAWAPPIPGADAPNVYKLKWVEDATKIREAAEESSKAVVVGASAIGLEVGTELAHRGINTTIVELLPQILPRALDDDIASTVQDHLISKYDKLKILTGVSAKEIIVEDGKAKKVITDKGEFEADFIVMATGVRPEVTLAKEAGLEIGERGGIKTDKEMITSDKNILAAGDCAETVDLIMNEPLLPLLATSGVRMGRVAAMTITKPNKVTFPGTLNNFVVPLHDLHVGSVGFPTDYLKEKGYKIVPGKIRTHDKPDYMPDATEFYFKVLIDKETGKFLGAQAVGASQVTDNLNVISMAMQNDMTFTDVLESDLCYAPAINETIYPVTKAIEIAARRLLR